MVTVLSSVDAYSIVYREVLFVAADYCIFSTVHYSTNGVHA